MAKNQSHRILKKLFLRKTIYLEKILLFLIFFLSPSQLSKHFWFPWSFVFGIRVDYLAFSLSIVDILIYCLFFVFVFRKFLEKGLHNVAFREIFSPFVFFFVLLNMLVSVIPQNTFFYFLKTLPLFLLFFYLRNYKKSFYNFFFFACVASLVFFGLIGVLQVVFGKTLGGVFWFLGERSFDVNTPGIALFSFLGQDHLRAYSTFPHPNVLSGYFVVIVFLLLSVVYKIWHGKTFIFLTIFLSFFPFVLSFSLNSFFSLLVVFVILFLKRFFGKKVFLYILSSVFIFSFIFLFILPGKLDVDLGESVVERLHLLSLAGRVFLQKPFLGVGFGNFIPSTVYQNVSWGMSNYLLQPVHNIYALVLSEGGLFGFVFFYIFFLRLFLFSFARGKTWLLSALAFIMITGLFDHYWLTLDQGRLAFVFLISFLFKNGKQL